MPEHNELIGAQLHPPQPLTFTGAVGSYTPPSAGVLAVRTDVEPRLLYVTTGTTAGALVPFGTEGVGATIAIGAVTTLGPEEPASVVNTGTPAAAVLDFGLPSGSPGDPGTAATIPLLAAPPAAPPDPLPAAGTAAFALETSTPPVLWAYDGAAWSFVTMTVQTSEVVLLESGDIFELESGDILLLESASDPDPDPGPVDDAVLLESGDIFELESGDVLLLESAS